MIHQFSGLKTEASFFGFLFHILSKGKIKFKKRKKISPLRRFNLKNQKKMLVKEKINFKNKKNFYRKEKTILRIKKVFRCRNFRRAKYFLFLVVGTSGGVKFFISYCRNFRRSDFFLFLVVRNSAGVKFFYFLLSEILAE